MLQIPVEDKLNHNSLFFLHFTSTLNVGLILIRMFKENNINIFSKK